LTVATVYIYRVVLDSVNGVSSTRQTSIAALSFKEGVVRQLQFVEDDTLVILYSDSEASYLLNLPFRPASVLDLSEEVEPLAVPLNYNDNNPQPTTEKPAVQSTPLDIASLLGESNIVIHTFASSGPKSNPLHIDVNGRRGRRAICVLYGDAMRYEVLDLDAELEEEEYDEEEEEEDEDENIDYD
jgi:anaphase-promoting complex subunit 4